MSLKVCGGKEEGTTDCKCLTRKGDKLDGVIGKGRKTGKNRCKWSYVERDLLWECLVLFHHESLGSTQGSGKLYVGEHAP